MSKAARPLTDRLKIAAHGARNYPTWLPMAGEAAALLDEAAARLSAYEKALERISVLDGANAPPGVPTAEFLRGIARDTLSADPPR